jgi:hypothetical protein
VPDFAHPAAAEHLQDLIALTENLAFAERNQSLRHVKGEVFALGAGRGVRFASVLRHVLS